MAKMFITLAEAQEKLGKSEGEIKAYCREGRLREFRDGPRLMFKVDQVEALAIIDSVIDESSLLALQKDEHETECKPELKLRDYTVPNNRPRLIDVVVSLIILGVIGYLFMHTRFEWIP